LLSVPCSISPLQHRLDQTQIHFVWFGCGASTY
jgi:hypothetical protein